MIRLPAARGLVTHLVPIAFAAVALLLLIVPETQSQSSVRPPDSAVSTSDEAVGGAVPGGALGTSSDSETWRAVRFGAQGTVSIPDEKAGVLVQSDGENWRLVRTGPFFDYLGLAMLATLALLALFYALRGRIRIEHGFAGVLIRRFSTLERTGHWLMAVSFIVLAITGLNISFGKDLVMPLIGKEAFGPMSSFLKSVHNYVAFAFIAGLAIAFVTWVIHNIPNRHDLVWLAKGGGIFVKGVHPPSRKFNAGQKIIFWLVMLGGLSLILSGWALLFPFEHYYFTDTFAAFAAVGIDVPAILGLPEPPYSAIQEQQFATLWHAIVAVFMICVILAHIYIGSVGMEGAFDAMGSGDVDLNWAKEHHSIWVEEVQAKEQAGEADAKTQPAE